MKEIKSVLRKGRGQSFYQKKIKKGYNPYLKYVGPLFKYCSFTIDFLRFKLVNFIQIIISLKAASECFFIFQFHHLMNVFIKTLHFALTSNLIRMLSISKF